MGIRILQFWSITRLPQLVRAYSAKEQIRASFGIRMKGHKEQGKRCIFVSLHSEEAFVDGFGPIEGFEIFKLSNNENSLASSSPMASKQDSSSWIFKILHSVIGRIHVTTTVFFAVIVLVNIIVHLVQKNWGGDCIKEDNPSARGQRIFRPFSLAELKLATEDFFEGYVIGKGGFGKVYQGLINNGLETVAIKRLKAYSKQGKREFWTEVETLSELRHVNLVSLIGYCNDQNELILVYEYMPFGTLADHLYKLARKNNARLPLSWKQRLKICIGAGRGLDYLHTGHGLIHRDVKPSNILLDEKFVAKIADFGLAKIESQDSTKLKGTFGYIDPDYFKSHKLSTKSDTYSFGVVLLEVLCGRPAVDHEVEEDKRSLTIWAQNHISKGEVDQIVAPSLRGEISPNSLETFVMAIEGCLLDEPKKRLAIAHVVIKLELALEQQENAESSAPRERTSIASLFPNEMINEANGVFAQKENVRFHVADALPRADKSRQEKARSLSHNVKSSVDDTILGNNKTRPAVSTRLSSVLSNLKVIFSLPIKQRTRKMTDVLKKGERKSALYRLSQPLFQREAFWNTRKSPKNKVMVSNSLSAPLARRSSNMTIRGSTVSEKMVGRSELILNPDLRILLPELSMRVLDQKENTESAVPYETTKVVNALPIKENAKLSEPNEITAPISCGTSNMTLRGSTVSEEITGNNELVCSPHLRIFSYSELMTASMGFRDSLIVGEGGFGRVYEGWLKEEPSVKNGNGSVVAIKKWNSEGLQGFREWQTEVEIMGRICHPNVVKLLGHCREDEELLLVYEFMQKGSLEKHLFGGGSPVEPLPWDIRIKILIGAARGLAFLHSSEKQVIYRDFKASNILLDESYNAKLTDFGLARLGPVAGDTHVSTGVMGTHGYAAPEYVATGPLHVKSDVYGFGVVLVEMLTGLQALDTQRPSGQHNLVDWIKPRLCKMKSLKKVMDSSLRETSYPPKSALKVARIALNCLQHMAKSRPSMQEIVEELERIGSAGAKPGLVWGNG